MSNRDDYRTIFSLSKELIDSIHFDPRLKPGQSIDIDTRAGRAILDPREAELPHQIGRDTVLLASLLLGANKVNVYSGRSRILRRLGLFVESWNREERVLMRRRSTLAIGRAAGNGLVLAGNTVSGNHAELQWEEKGTLRISDVGSTNDTIVLGFGTEKTRSE